MTAAMRRTWWHYVLGAALPLLCGCPDAPDKAYPVHGVVSLDGVPLTGGAVRFEPTTTGTASRRFGARGVIQADGTYCLTTFASGDGAMTGRHRVVILPDSSGQEIGPGPGTIPAHYLSLAGSGLEVDVQTCKNRIDIPLVSDRVAITGTVRLDGKPLTGGEIVFVPSGGAGVSRYMTRMAIHGDGTYRFTTDKPGEGIVPGKYRVTVIPPGEPASQQKTPPPLGRPGEIVIPPQDAVQGPIDIDLTSTPTK
jgi:hypothetical protein